MPSPDELADPEDEEDFVSFYVYGEHGISREYHVDRTMIEGGSMRGKSVTVDYASDYVLEIVPLFKAPEYAAPDRRFKMVCDECGSDSVLADAYAQWDIEKQDWTVANVFDKGAFCPDCDGDARIEEVELGDGGEASAQAA
jgi:hypothetical protein